MEPLGDRAWRIAIAGADEGRARAAALRASGRVDDAWHTETYVAFTPRADGEVAALAMIAGAGATDEGREHAIRIVLDGADLDDIAAAAGMARGDVERMIVDASLRVSFVGFAPGFGYLRGLDPRLHLPRRATPRPRVPAGSLALAGGFAAVYPSATAGGWNLIGRALDPMWLDDAPRLAAGDRVGFVPVAAGEPPATIERTADPARALIIDEIRGLAFVEDGGRRSRLHQGMPPAGALVPSALARANRAVGNPDDAAGIERHGTLRLAATVAIDVATDDGARHRLAPGDVLDLPWPATARAGYVAITGGLDVPIVLGGRGTHLRAGLGGHHGRQLRRGDRIAIGTESRTGTDAGTGAGTATASDAPITIVPGPDLAHLAPGALDRLLAATVRLSHRSDRMGTRLDGATLPHAADAPPPSSAPLVLGAIEVPPDGVPIVLGPEHPTTGGYPVVAVIAAADLDAFHRRPLGRALRFRLR